MSDTNQITVRGWVGTDPDVIITGNGKEVTKFRLGSTRGFRDSTTGEWRDNETEWFTVKVWGQAGEPIRQSVRRGMPVLVQGVLSFEEWLSGEQTRRRNVITASAIGVDVKHGLVSYAKVTRLGSAEDGPPPDLTEGDPQEPDPPERSEQEAGAPEGSEDSSDPVLAPGPVDPYAWERSTIDA